MFSPYWMWLRDWTFVLWYLEAIFSLHFRQKNPNAFSNTHYNKDESLCDTHHILWAQEGRAAARQAVAFRYLFLFLLPHHMTVSLNHRSHLKITDQKCNCLKKHTHNHSQRLQSQIDKNIEKGFSFYWAMENRKLIVWNNKHQFSGFLGWSSSSF